MIYWTDSHNMGCWLQRGALTGVLWEPGIMME